MVFEFVRAIQEEADKARGAGDRRRAAVMSAIKDRFPDLLRSLQVEVWDSGFAFEDIGEAYELLSKGRDPGDSMIWIKMRRAGISKIATADVSDWEALGAHVVSLA